MYVTNEILWKMFQDNDCTKTDFCKKLGYNCGTSNMSKWLSNKDELSLNKLKEFCDRLGYKLKIELDA